MMNNRIRLTESQLHKVIKESVKQVLSELDWKTFANAAKVAREKGRDTRMFDRAAEDALNREYGGRHSVNTDDRHIQRFHSYNDNPFSTSYDYAHRPLDGYEDDWPSYEGMNPNNSKYNPGGQEIANFVKGKNKYVKGKGWQ